MDGEENDATKAASSLLVLIILRCTDTDGEPYSDASTVSPVKLRLFNNGGLLFAAIHHFMLESEMKKYADVLETCTEEERITFNFLIFGDMQEYDFAVSLAVWTGWFPRKPVHKSMHQKIRTYFPTSTLFRPAKL